MSESKQSVDERIKDILATAASKDPDQAKFLQAVEEVVSSIKPLFEKYPHYLDVMKVIIEPERVLQFRVPWVDDAGVHRINRGFRVQFNSALGPYKGGLRFHPSVNLSTIKFLGYEQTFKNALTGLPMGGGKGGSDFNPKGKSDREVLAFCQSFMTELYRHIGENVDVPAGDIGVGGREIGYLLGQFKRITKNNQGGVLTGKGTGWGGSFVRTEATGFGLTYMTDLALKAQGQSFKDKICFISGSGNVAQYAATKVTELGGKVVTLSDSGGFVLEPNGFTPEQIKHIIHLKTVKRGRIKEYCAFSKTAKYTAGARPWGAMKGDIALPCATENEISLDDMKKLVSSGVKLVAEGANMPTATDAIHYAKDQGLTFLPAKAANAGGVGTSGLEMAQNSARYQWEPKEVDQKLRGIMKHIHDDSLKMSKELGHDGDYQLGANALGFKIVAEAMLAQGQVI